MHKILLALLLCLASLAPASAQSTNGHSLAYYINYDTGAWGFGLGYDSTNQAEHAAFDGCGGRPCRLALYGTGRCMAMFKSQGGKRAQYGLAYGQSKRETEARAKQQCMGTCVKQHSQCID